MLKTGIFIPMHRHFFITIKSMLFLLLLPAIALAQKNRPLTGSYPASPYSFSVAKPCKEVWGAIMAMEDEEGDSIATVVPKDFLLVSSPAWTPVTTEKGDGSLNNPGAYFVAPTIWDNDNGNWELRTPTTVRFQYCIHLIGCESGKTSGEIKLIHIQPEKAVQNGLTSENVPVDIPIKSTGVFEQKLYDGVD